MRPYLVGLFLGLSVSMGMVLLADPAHRWHRFVPFPSRPLLVGEIWVHPPDIDERLMKLFWLRAAATPDVVVLGNSRSMLWGSNLFPGRRVLNLAVSSASLEDLLGLWQEVKRENKLPRLLVLAIDPALLDANVWPLGWLSLQEQVESWFLADEHVSIPGRFWIRLRSYVYLTQRALAQSADLMNASALKASLKYLVAVIRSSPQGEVISRISTSANLGSEEDGTWWDGTHHWADRAVIDRRKVLTQTTALESPAIVPSESFRLDAPSQLLKVIADVKGIGGQVLIYLPPFQPFALKLALERAGVPSVLERYKALLEGIAAASGAELCDAIDPLPFGCPADEFIDSIHPTRQCIERLGAECLGRLGLVREPGATTPSH